MRGVSAATGRFGLDLIPESSGQRPAEPTKRIHNTSGSAFLGVAAFFSPVGLVAAASPDGVAAALWVSFPGTQVEVIAFAESLPRALGHTGRVGIYLHNTLRWFTPPSPTLPCFCDTVVAFRVVLILSLFHCCVASLLCSGALVCFDFVHLVLCYFALLGLCCLDFCFGFLSSGSLSFCIIHSCPLTYPTGGSC